MHDNLRSNGVPFKKSLQTKQKQAYHNYQRTADKLINANVIFIIKIACLILFLISAYILFLYTAKLCLFIGRAANKCCVQNKFYHKLKIRRLPLKICKRSSTLNKVHDAVKHQLEKILLALNAAHYVRFSNGTSKHDYYCMFAIL